MSRCKFSSIHSRVAGPHDGGCWFKKVDSLREKSFEGRQRVTLNPQPGWLRVLLTWLAGKEGMDKTMAPTKLCVAGNEGIDKKMETTIIGYVETRTRQWSPPLS